MKGKRDATSIDSDKVISKPGRDAVKAQSSKSHFGYYETRGARPSQEDALAWERFNPETLAELSPVDIAYRLWTTYRLLDSEVCRTTDSGSTASTTVYDAKGNLITATLADAASFAAVYSTDGHVLGVVRLNSVTHKPTDASEEKRINDAGGMVIGGRVSSILAVSRAIGDAFLKGSGVSSEANLDITNIDDLARTLKIKRKKIGSIQVITTCDGFTDGAGPDRQTKEGHEEFLRTALNNKPKNCINEADISEHLSQIALVQGSRDNVSVSVQTLPLNNEFAIFQGVYDGHGGSQAAHHIADNITRIFNEQCVLTQEDYNAQDLSVEKNKVVFQRDNAGLEQPKSVVASVLEEILPAAQETSEVAVDVDSSSVKTQRLGELAAVRTQLDILLQKKGELKSKRITKNDNYDLAARAAKRVYNKLETNFNNYADNKISKQTMMAQVNEVLKEDSQDIQTLNSHRGWKQVLVDIATAFAGLFVIYVIAAAVKGSFTLFSVNTDTGNKINDIKQALNDINQQEAQGPR